MIPRLSEEGSCFRNSTLINRKEIQEKVRVRGKEGKEKGKKEGNENLNNTAASGVKILVHHFLKKKD